MGYESKLYVVDKLSNQASIRPDGMQYCNVIAMIDLCKYYKWSNKAINYPMTSCYFYTEDGKTQILEDGYGDPLREIPLDDAIEIFEEEFYSGEDYRRLVPTLTLLQSLKDNENQWNEIVVLHYGY